MSERKPYLQCRSWCKMDLGADRVRCQKKQAHAGQHEGRWSEADLRVVWDRNIISAHRTGVAR